MVWLVRFDRLELVFLVLWLPGRRILKTFYAGHRLLPRTSRLDRVVLASLGCVLKDGGDYDGILCRLLCLAGGGSTIRIWVLDEDVISDG